MFNFLRVKTEKQEKLYFRIAEEVFADSYFEEYEINEFWHIDTDSDSKYYLIVINEEELGVVAVNIDDEENGATIDTIGILPEYRGRGLGKKLMKAIETELLSDVDWITVEFIADDIDLFNYYISCGFTIDSINIYIYEDNKIIFKSGILEFRDKVDEFDDPDFIPWVEMSKEYIRMEDE